MKAGRIMTSNRSILRCSLALLLGLLALSAESVAAEAVSYTYDALGRVLRMQVSGGVQNGVQESYEYDAADNRTYRNTVTAAAPRPATIAATSATVGTMAGNARLTVNISGTNPGGTVAFTLNGLFVSSAPILNGQARTVLSGLASGTYSVTATYSGDANNDPSVTTYSIVVRDLSWLPAVLDLLLN